MNCHSFIIFYINTFDVINKIPSHQFQLQIDLDTLIHFLQYLALLHVFIGDERFLPLFWYHQIT